jgi:iduronate 2-sulfatase
MNLLVIFCVLLFAGLLNPHTHAAEQRKPNVLFIIADDLNVFLGCYGDPIAKTPNLDQLAKRGVRFEKAYCTFPLCGPSRNSMLTGLYPNSNGILANAQIFRQTVPERISLPQAFRQQGYFAARVGKLYHYNVPTSIGTEGHDDPASWELQLNPAGVDRTEEEGRIFSLRPGSFGGSLSWYASQKQDSEHTDGKIAADAAWVLERCAKQKDRPFFLAVGFFRPHTPYVAPKKPYYDFYQEQKMRVVPNVKEDQLDIPPAALASYKPEQDKLDDELRRSALQAYYASISFMDTQLGNVIGALDRLGLSENTIIVFTSDHGYHTGEHGLWQKQSLFEESARVPLLIVTPDGCSKNAVAKSPVSHIDIFPTLMELAGLRAPAGLQGQSLIQIIKNPDAQGRGWSLSQVVRGGGFKRFGASPSVGDEGKRFFGYSIRTNRWRYTEWDEGKQGTELYDHDTDPSELMNVAGKPEHAALVNSLQRQLRDAAKSSFPQSGTTPELKKDTGLWAPQFIE